MGLKAKTVLLDRDGVLVAKTAGYLLSPVDVLPGVIGAVAWLREHAVVKVVSNQACVGKGLLSEDDLWLITKGIQEQIGDVEFVYCLHTEADACSCRKPATAMLQGDVLVGDTWRDAEGAKRAGIPFVGIGNCMTCPTASNLEPCNCAFGYPNLLSAVPKILEIINACE